MVERCLVCHAKIRTTALQSSQRVSTCKLLSYILFSTTQRVAYYDINNNSTVAYQNMIKMCVN